MMSSTRQLGLGLDQDCGACDYHISFHDEEGKIRMLSSSRKEPSLHRHKHRPGRLGYWTTESDCSRAQSRCQS